MTTVCPQRILREASKLLLLVRPDTDELAERIDNNMVELDDLARALPNKVKVQEGEQTL